MSDLWKRPLAPTTTGNEIPPFKFTPIPPQRNLRETTTNLAVIDSLTSTQGKD